MTAVNPPSRTGISTARRFLRWLDRHTVTVCTPSLPYRRMAGQAD